jgi:membrane-bound serine protease (ClpP class)
MWVVLGLFVIGITLILSEFFVPGLVLGTLGALVLIGSGVYGWMLYPQYGVFIVGAEFIAAVSVLLLGMYLISRTKAGQVMVLQSRQALEAGYAAPSEDESLVGAAGEAFTPLRPAGTVFVGEKRINAVSSGEYIEKGAKVRVIEVEGARVVVERADGP